MVYTGGLKKIQNKIFLPVNISILTSVGIHALFFSVMLPKWDFTDSQQNKKSLSNTPVIQLNSLEKTRLPDLSSRKWSNWNLIPKIGDNNLGINQIAPPPINSFQFPLINNNSLPNLPPPPSLSSLPSIPTHTFDIPRPLTLPPPPPLDPIDSKIVAAPPAPINQGITNITIKQQEKNNLRDSLFPPAPNTVIRSPRVLINRQNNSAQQTTQNQKITSNLSKSTNNPNPVNQNQVAVKSPPVKPSNYTELASALQKDVSNTTSEEATKNDLAWRSEVKVAQPKRIEMIGLYPKDACIRKLEGKVAYGVTVNDQGQLTNTKLLKSGGLAIFNQQALRQIQSKNFSATGQPEAYHVYVDFKPNNCPSLSLDNLGKIPPKKQALPKTNVENSPQLQQNQQPITSPSPRKPEAKEANQPSTSSPMENKPSQQVMPNAVTTESAKPPRETDLAPEKKPTPATSNPVTTESPLPSGQTESTPAKKPTPATSNAVTTESAKPPRETDLAPEKKPTPATSNAVTTESPLPSGQTESTPAKKPTPATSNAVTTESAKPPRETDSPPEKKPTPATSNAVTTQSPLPLGETSPLPAEKKTPVKSNSHTTNNKPLKSEENDSSLINQSNIEDKQDLKGN